MDIVASFRADRDGGGSRWDWEDLELVVADDEVDLDGVAVQRAPAFVGSAVAAQHAGGRVGELGDADRGRAAAV
ncbi:hypothetical protein ABZU76_39665 [Amycolatopsis sp. NPDC005232]|uniref:hypothetical protein n=1 Tax=Amycolatopsis sp. NPDC005232 TaxID=3157027 RepID=UPI0033B31B08